MKGEYTSPIFLTSQFRFCPNAFRIDMYKGCSFGCNYCFTSNRSANGHQGAGLADISKIKRLFEKAFEYEDSEEENLTVELLRHRVPLHCGGMSDPFQTREFEYKLTYGLIELSNKYNYPIMFSTKTASLPEEYFEILNPELHAFQVSIMGWNDDYIKKYETNTPTAKERLDFVKKLRDKGFWAGIRIQPLANLQEALELVRNAGSTPSFITVEHLKLPADNNAALEKFKTDFSNFNWKLSSYNMRNIEPEISQKIENIKAIQEIANSNGVLVGVGDNDLHHMSQCRTCCGVDTVNKNFDNYIKYNLTYFATNTDPDIDVSDLWTPKCSVKSCFYVEKGDRKDYRYISSTKNYIRKHTELLVGPYASNIEKQLFDVSQNKLF